MQSWRAEPSVDAERQALLLLREEEGDAAHGRGEGAASDAAHRCAADLGKARRAGLSEQNTIKSTQKCTKPPKSVRNTLRYTVNSQNVNSQSVYSQN